MKFKKTQYRFDPETLSYKKIETSLFSWFLKTLLPQSAIAIILGIFFFFVFSNYMDSPEVSELKRHKTELVSKYEILSEQIHKSMDDLSKIQNHDDNIYRVIFEKAPIPASVRQAGFGGVNRYKKYEGYESSDEVVLDNAKLDKLAKQIVVQSKSFDDIIKLVINKEKMLASIPAIQPIAIKDLVRFGSSFGMRFHPILHVMKMHTGVDLTARTGTPVYAAGDGIVIRADHASRGYGNHVRIDHGFGYVTLYGHMSKLKVKKGQHVKRGDVIGLVGSTGRSTGPHLHYEVRINGKPVNPINYYFNDLSASDYQKVINLAQDSTTHTFIDENIN